MNERDQNSSGLRTAASLAGFANSVRKIAKAAAQYGIKGAAAAAVRPILSERGFLNFFTFAPKKIKITLFN